MKKRYIRKDGSSFWARLHVSVVRDGRGKPLYLTVQIEDIDERRRAEEALRQSQQSYEALVHSIDGIVWEADAQTFQFSYVSPQAERLLGYPVERWLAEATFWRDHVHPDDREWAVAFCMKATREKRDHDFEYRMIAADGRTVWLRDIVTVVVKDDQPLKLRGIMVDITEQKRLEEQLRHAQKLEAIGLLAGGVAHEFNNLLTAMICNLDLAKKQAADLPDLQPFLNSADEAAHRAAMLARQLLTFSRRSPTKLQPQDLGSIAKEVIGLLCQTIDRRIEVEFQPEEGLWPVLADADQMKQVIMNLCVNARDALMERLAQNTHDKSSLTWQPRIAVKTVNVQVGEADGRLHPDAKPGDYVCLSVSDNGWGMDESIQHRVFEPFFTTKPRTHQSAVPVEERASEETVARGTETILFVDDEAPLRRLGQTILEHHGYTVLLAKDGVEALEIFTRERERIQLIVLDLTMPRQSGQEVLRQLLALNPKVKVIVSSGHHGAGGVTEFLDRGTVGFVPKPYSPDELAQSVRRLLDQPDSL